MKVEFRHLGWSSDGMIFVIFGYCVLLYFPFVVNVFLVLAASETICF